MWSHSEILVWKWWQAHHVTHLYSIFGPIDLLLAVRSPHISGMRCGSALFSSKVLSMWGLCVLWSRLQMSHLSVRNVPLNLLPVFSGLCYSWVSFLYSFSHLTPWNTHAPDDQENWVKPPKISIKKKQNVVTFPAPPLCKKWQGVAEWVKSESPEWNKPEFEPQLSHFLAVKPWTRSVTFLQALIFLCQNTPDLLRLLVITELNTVLMWIWWMPPFSLEPLASLLITIIKISCFLEHLLCARHSDNYFHYYSGYGNYFSYICSSVSTGY